MCQKIAQPARRDRTISHDSNGRDATGSMQKGMGKGRGVLFRHTDTARSHISCNHDGTLASFEFVKDPVTLILLLVAVDSWMLLVHISKTIGHDLQSAGQPSCRRNRVISSATRLVPVKMRILLARSSMICSRCLVMRSRFSNSDTTSTI